MKYILLILFVLLDMPGFSSEIDSNQSQLSFLKKLVSVSSGTNDLAGVSAVQKLMADELKSLGFTIDEFSADDEKVKSKQIVATKKGEIAQFITFVGHADTVFEKLNPLSTTTDEKRLQGSGVGDDKGGLVVGLDSIRRLMQEKELPHHSIRFVISSSEETGSVGFRARLKEYSKDSVLILGMEPALPDGAIVHARKGVRWYLLKVTGAEAHAGVNPEDGVNACQQLAYFVGEIMKINDFKNGNTVSVGRMDGGKDKFNIVCGSAEAKIDVRFVDTESRDKIHKKIETILKKITVKSFNKKQSAKVEYEIVTEVPPFATSELSKKTIDQYLKTIQTIEGRSVKSVRTGGAADLNYMSGGTGLMLDGLGPIGGGYHTGDEYIELPSLATRTTALSKFLISFDKNASH